MGVSESTNRTHPEHEIQKLHDALRYSSSKGHQSTTHFTLLGQAYYQLYEDNHRQGDLDNAVKYLSKGLESCPMNEPAQGLLLNSLGLSLRTRFGQQGRMDDLKAVAAYHKEALTLHPAGHLNHAMSLNSFANTLQTQFEHLGDINDLEEAIACHYKALDLRPPSHPDCPTTLNNLAIALGTRFKCLRDFKDLEEAEACCKQILGQWPSEHPHRYKILNNLAINSKLKFKQAGIAKDLEDAITYYCQALSLLPSGHSEYPALFSNLAGALHTQFKQSRETKHLEEAIFFHKKVLNLCPPGHPYHSKSLRKLAGVLQVRFNQEGDISDLNLATKSYAEASLYTPEHDTFQITVMVNQASQQVTLHESHWVVCQDCSHINDACSIFEAALAINDLISSLHQRFKAARKWASAAHRYKHPSAIAAYSKALLLHQQHVSLLPTMASQQRLLAESSMLSLDAASCAIKSGFLEIAVEFLEQGRATLWSRMEGYRHPTEQISLRDPELAKQFKLVSQQLEHHAISQDVSGDTNTGMAYEAKVKFQRTLSEKWAELLQKIRGLEGFSNYLQATPFHVLQNAASEGPVIIINISNFQSDVLILCSSSSPVVISLPDITPEVLEQLVLQLRKITTGTSSSTRMAPVLQHLWVAIVKPIVEQLAVLEIPEKSHIWWCPTSYLWALPLHAAGPYKKNSKNLPDMYISSYIPTLASLIKARSGISKIQATPNLLLVSQPDGTIPKVLKESEIIQSFGNHVHHLCGEAAQKHTVLSSLQKYNWTHFACHGHLEEQPFNSWFQLYDNECLTVLNLIEVQLPDAEFAFLSSCNSAAGDIYGTPDEAIHLAAALQFCGFKSVIGTLWAMEDEDGPIVADIFYQHMFRNPNTVSLRDAAKGLNLATRYLRKRKSPLVQWVNFVHIGA